MADTGSDSWIYGFTCGIPGAGFRVRLKPSLERDAHDHGLYPKASESLCKIHQDKLPGFKNPAHRITIAHPCRLVFQAVVSAYEPVCPFTLQESRSTFHMSAFTARPITAPGLQVHRQDMNARAACFSPSPCLYTYYVYIHILYICTRYIYIHRFVRQTLS